MKQLQLKLLNVQHLPKWFLNMQHYAVYTHLSKFRRHARPLASGETVITWIDINHQKNIALCDMLPLKEVDILDAYKRVVTKYAGDLKEIIQVIKENANLELNSSSEDRLESISNELLDARKEIMKLFEMKNNKQISKDEYMKKYMVLSNLIEELTKEENSIKNQYTKEKIKEDKIKQVITLLENDEIDLTEPSII